MGNHPTFNVRGLYTKDELLFGCLAELSRSRSGVEVGGVAHKYMLLVIANGKPADTFVEYTSCTKPALQK
jgi:hypothetical protein